MLVEYEEGVEQDGEDIMVKEPIGLYISDSETCCDVVQNHDGDSLQDSQRESAG